MSVSLLAVEGAHDAAFFGLLLRKRGYSYCTHAVHVPPSLKILIPAKFPNNLTGYLGRVVQVPDFYTKGTHSVVLVSAGGDSKLVEAIRSVLEALGEGQIKAIGIAIDADDIPVGSRFQSIIDQLLILNEKAVEEGVPGFPLMLPTGIGQGGTGDPLFNIHIFPDNSSSGALEDIIIACGSIHHAEIDAEVGKFCSAVEKSLPPGHSSLVEFRKSSHRKKAHAGTFANVISPGSSLAVALIKNDWIKDPSVSEAVSLADGFLASIL